MPDLEEPLSAERPQFDPELRNQRSAKEWRAVTNFVEAKDILGRFDRWPDDFLTAERLSELYREECEHACDSFTREVGAKVRPAFPFLDETESSRLAELFESIRGAALPVLRTAFGAAPLLRQPPVPAAGWFWLAFQSQIIVELRQREREVGVWEERTACQKTGTIFALRPDMPATFCRVASLPISEDSFICVPWGGPYAEYSKVLPLLEDPHTQWVIASADDKLEVVPEGHALKRMVAAGLLKEERVSFMIARWTLAMPVLEWEQAREVIPAASVTARNISQVLADSYPQLLSLMRTGRYSYLDGIGDYFAMAYSAFLGHLCQWAMDDGLIGRPPKFGTSKHGPVMEISRAERRSAGSKLPGMTLVRHAEAPWDGWVGTGH